MSKIEITDEMIRTAMLAFNGNLTILTTKRLRATLEAVAPLIAAHERDRANAESAQAARMTELRDAVRFLDRVKAACTDEQIAVGTDAWFRLEDAARKLIEVMSPAAKGTEE